MTGWQALIDGAAFAWTLRHRIIFTIGRWAWRGHAPEPDRSLDTYVVDFAAVLDAVVSRPMRLKPTTEQRRELLSEYGKLLERPPGDQGSQL